MTQNQFHRIKNQFDQGQVDISNQRNTTAFLYNKKWYPARKFTSQVHPNITTQEAIKYLLLLMPYLRIKKDVNFIGSNNFPIPLTTQETIDEARLVLEKLNELYREN